MSRLILWLVGVLMALPLLTIGTSTERINLLNRRGFHVQNWDPASPDTADTYRESGMADYRQLVAFRDLNILETFEMLLRHRTQNQSIAAMRQLRRMLRASKTYHASPRVDLEPVYLAARAGCEDMTRYAVVKSGRILKDDNPYDEPFIGPDAGMDELTLQVEHGPWLENAPGIGTCVQVSGLQAWPGAQTDTSDSPTASTDDTWVNHTTLAINNASTYLEFGQSSGDSIDTGIRFRSVNVPQGAIILSARIQFESQADAAVSCSVYIFGEDTDTSAAFSTYADFVTRPLTSSFVDWKDVEAWVATNTYYSPGIASIVQEIVNRPGWVANNDLTIFIKEHLSGANGWRRAVSWDHVTGREPILLITYTTTEPTFGRAATCLDEVYVANKHNQAQLTHAYHYTAIGAVWSANLMAAALPYDLLPAAPANNDIIYFGIQSTLADSGPFASVVLDIGTAAAYVGAAHVHWQYSQGGGVWATLAVQDNTAASGAQPFSVTGVGSIHWVQPSDWATDAVNGITGFWVRAVLQIGGGESISTPTQQNRLPYTIVWPFVEIQAAQVGGDLPALAELHIKNVSDGPSFGGTTSPDLYSNRLLVGLRSVSRGENYTPYIVVCDEQKNTNITVTVGANTSIIDDSTAATGRCTRYNPAGVEAMANRALIYIRQPLSVEYYGIFHAFLRARQSGGTAGQIGVQLQFTHGSGVATYTTPTLYFANTNADQLLDFGRVQIPLADLSDSELADYLLISIRASSTSGTPNLDIYEFAIFPADEWLMEAKDPANTFNSIVGRPGGDNYTRYLDLDSITWPKSMMRATVKRTDGFVTATWRPACNSSFVLLHPNERQRLWFLSNRTSTAASTDERCEPEVAFSIQVWRVNQYESMRGAT